MPSPAAFAPLAPLLEVKRTLDGREKRFECRVLRRAQDAVVVLFVAPEPMRVHGVELPAGTVTFGHFWRDRPYNVYHWLRRTDGAPIGIYANLADDTRLEGETLTWLDLVVDVLILPGAEPVILDEDELPQDLPAKLSARVGQARAAFFQDLAALLIEVDEARRELWPGAVAHLAVQAGRPAP